MHLQISSLNTNARMYLYDTPRDTMAKNLMLQSLCSTSTWKASRLMPNTSNIIFSCVLEHHAQHKYKYSCAPELLSQHNINYTCAPEILSQHNINYSCAPKLLSQHKTSHQSCASGSIPNTNKHIYIINNGLCPIYKTNHHDHMQLGVRPNISK